MKYTADTADSDSAFSSGFESLIGHQLCFSGSMVQHLPCKQAFVSSNLTGRSTLKAHTAMFLGIFVASKKTCALFMGVGTARSGHPPCKRKSRRVQISYPPPKAKLRCQSFSFQDSSHVRITQLGRVLVLQTRSRGFEPHSEHHLCRRCITVITRACQVRYAGSIPVACSNTSG